MMHFNVNSWFPQVPKWMPLTGAIFLIFLSLAGYSQSTCSTPFFSEYIEGSSSNKAIELFNPSDEAIDLSQYEIQVFVNAGTDPRFSLVPQGMLAPRTSYVIANTRADFADSADTTASVAGFNGDDAIILVDSEGNTLDAIGVVGEQPDNGWTVGEGSTENFTLVRSASVTEGTANWAQGASGWEVLEIDDFSNLGSHSFDSSACESVMPGGMSIVINEFRPTGEDLIELKNYGTQTVDITEWWLCARFVYVQMNSDDLSIEGSTVMEPGDILTISGFDLFDASSDIGIYSTNSFASAEAMVAFAQYGGAGIGRESVAAAAGIWEAGDFIADIGEGNSAEYVGMNASGTALVASGDYVVQSQPTFGEENKLICTADAGGVTSLGIAEGDCEDGMVTLEVESNGDAVVPEGYSTLFVLTQGDELVIRAVSEAPLFEVEEDGIFTIHTLVYNADASSPDFLDLDALTIGETTGADVLNLIAANEVCASLDVAGALFDVACSSNDTCTANAGTLTANPLGPDACIEEGDSLVISATPGNDSEIPEEFEIIYFLTQGEELIIIDQGGEPSFTIGEAGSYTLHTLVYTGNPELADFFDLTSVSFGETTIEMILDSIQLRDICADLDVEGASFVVEVCEVESCTITPGTLTANALDPDACIDAEGNSIEISATPNGDAVIDSGFIAVYLLTRGDDLVIDAQSTEPSFTIVDTETYRIHTLVISSDIESSDFIVLDTSLVVGQSTGVDVINLIDSTGICAALDPVGAIFQIDSCDVIEPAPNCLFFSEYVEGSGDNKALEIYNACEEPVDLSNYEISTFVNGSTDPRFSFIPSGILAPGEVIVICNGGVEFPEQCDTTASITEFNGDDAIALVNLTNGDTLDIIGVIGEDPGTEWEVDNGTTRDHTIIRKSFVTEGNTDWTTAQNEWLGIGEDVSDSLGFHPHVEGPIEPECIADAGTLSADPLSEDDCLNESGDPVEISATPNGDAVIEPGFGRIYVLTTGSDLLIIDESSSPSFSVTEPGDYTIHTLVLNSDIESSDYLTIDSALVLGETTGTDVVTLIESTGICADLDVEGVSFSVDSCMVVDSCNIDPGSLTANDLGDDCIVLDSTTVVISATPNGDLQLQDGFAPVYVLSVTEDLLLVDIHTEPSFEVVLPGRYTIHTLVINTDPDSRDFLVIDTTIVLGESTGADVLQLIDSTGICAALDAEGAVFEVLSCPDDTMMVCEADAGSLTANELGEEDCIDEDNPSVLLSATPNGDQVVPEGSILAWLLTTGANLELVAVDTVAEFEVTEPGSYTIHSFVLDTTNEELAGLDTTDIIELAESFGSAGEAIAFLTDLEICFDIDVDGAVFEVEACTPDSVVCEAEAGTLTANELGEEDCIDEDNPTVLLSTTLNGDQVVPEGSVIAWVLTTGTDLELLAINEVPEFEVEEPGLYTIHTLVADTTSEAAAALDTLEITDFDTAEELIGLLTELEICYDIDVEGGSFIVDACTPDSFVCEVDAGTLTANDLGEEDCIDDTNATVVLSATPNGDQVVPDGSLIAWVLTQGADLALVAVDTLPEFEVAEPGIYTIHTLVIDTTLADLAEVDTAELVALAESFESAADVIAFLDEFGVCVDLDITGASFAVENCTVPVGECPEVCTLSNWNGNLAGPDFERPLNMAVVLHISPLDPYLMNGDYSNYQRFVWETAGQLTRYEDSLLITGTVVSKVDSGAQFDLELILVGGQSWEEFSAIPGRGEYIAAEGIGDAFMDWEYWYLSDESKMIGKGSLEGIELSLFHVPKDSSKAFQIGMGGNGFDLDEGLGGWFGYTGVFNGEEFKAVGDITVDIDGCSKADTCEVPVAALTSIREESRNTLQGSWNQTPSTSLSNERFTIFPNPSERFVNVRDRQPQKGSYTFKVFDLNGRTLQERVISNFNGNYLLDASQLPSNVHMLQVISPDGNIKTLKFTIK